MAAAKKPARKPRRQYTDEEKAGFREKQQAELKEIAASIEKGVESFRDSDRYKEFLSVMATFHNYSFRNVMLICGQNPNASVVAGFNKWKELGRHVKKGEKGLRILAPLMRKAKDDGREQAEEAAAEDQDKKVLYGFKAVSVFDVSQTEGKPLPSPVTEPMQAVDHFDALLSALQEISDVPIVLADPARMTSRFGDEVKGFFTSNAGAYGRDLGVPGIPPGPMICVRDGMSEAMTAKTLIHELAHSLLHGEGSEHKDDMQAIREFDAESVAFVVAKHLGIDTDDYTFGYLNSWVNDKTPLVLQTQLPLIVKTAGSVIGRLDPALQREILREQAGREMQPGDCRVWQVSMKEAIPPEAADLAPGEGTVNRSVYDLVYEGKAEGGPTGEEAKSIMDMLSKAPPAAFDTKSRLSVIEIRGGDGTSQAWCMQGGKPVPLKSFTEQGPARERPQIRRSEKKQEAMTR